ncbi:MAG: anthranilate phosphoribosyltransferase [Rhodospirillales bacterium]|jgi:anthranilate phosphoribosyltransferase|nr:anthranilate phosphoribosyltransferase [Rhodospirillales bacterium]
MDAPTLKPVLTRLAAGETLSAAAAEDAFGIIMQGEATPSQIAGLLMAMRVRGETVAEMVGAVRAMRTRMVTVEAPPGAMDIVGTGGDGAGTLNISTAAAFVLAGSGVPVAKHGNRAVSSKSGAADAITALGIGLDAPIENLGMILRDVGMVFLMAPRHHTALRHAAVPRGEMAVRTIFNLLGPLANPARVNRQMTGAFAPQWLRPMAETLAELGTERAWLVHGMGLDELTLAGESQVVALENGTIREFTISPEDAGLPHADIALIQGGDAAHNAGALVDLLQGSHGAYRDVVLLNTAAGLVVAGKASDLREGAALAATAIDSGAALDILNRLRRACPPKDFPQ